jgi:hypothetical protein
MKRKGISDIGDGEKRIRVEELEKLMALFLREIDIGLDELELVESIVKRPEEQIAQTFVMYEKAKLLDTLFLA